MRWRVNPLRGKTTDWRAVCGRSACTVWREGDSQSPYPYPVHHLDLAEGADHHVGGLEITVNNPVGVGVADGLADGLEDGQPTCGGAAVGRWVRPVFQDRLERASLDELHRQEGPAIGQGANLVHGRDSRVLQLTSDPCLTEEALGRYRIGRVALGEQLDGDIAIEGNIAGAIHNTHAPVANLVKEPRKNKLSKIALSIPAFCQIVSACRTRRRSNGFE